MASRVSSAGDMNDMICLHNFSGEFVNLLNIERLVYYVYSMMCVLYSAVWNCVLRMIHVH